VGVEPRLLRDVAVGRDERDTWSERELTGQRQRCPFCNLPFRLKYRRFRYISSKSSNAFSQVSSVPGWSAALESELNGGLAGRVLAVHRARNIPLNASNRSRTATGNRALSGSTPASSSIL